MLPYSSFPDLFRHPICTCAGTRRAQLWPPAAAPQDSGLRPQWCPGRWLVGRAPALLLLPPGPLDTTLGTGTRDGAAGKGPGRDQEPGSPGSGGGGDPRWQRRLRVVALSLGDALSGGAALSLQIPPGSCLWSGRLSPPPTPPQQGSLTPSLTPPHSLCWDMKTGGGMTGS